MLQLQEGVSGLIRWKEQEIDFRNTPMKEVLKELICITVSLLCRRYGCLSVFLYFCVKKASLEEVMRTLEIISLSVFEGRYHPVRMK